MGIPAELMTNYWSDKRDWNFIPDSVLLYIFNYLNATELLNAGRVCCTWWRVSRDDIMWKHLFHRDYKISSSIPLMPGANGWYDEYKRLHCDVPIVLSECIDAHSHQVLHVSFSHNGTMFATTSKDGTVMVWNSTYPSSVKYQHNMKEFSWKYTQFSQFNSSDTLLLVSGVHFGSHHSTSGEIAVFSLQNKFSLQCRVVNKPYDLFGCWIGDNHLISGDLHWLGHLTSSSFLWINKASQEPDSEHTPIIAPLYRFYNPNASSVRSILISNCLWAGDKEESEDKPQSNEKCPSSSDKEPQPSSAHAKQPSILYSPEYRSNNGDLSSSADESTSESESESISTTSQDDDLKNKLLIFTTGADTYTPHQIGFKRIVNVEFPNRISPGLSIKERLAARERERERERLNIVEVDYSNFDAVKDKFDMPDKLIDLHGHIIGMALSPDHKYLYVNSRPWPENYEIENPLTPPPIAFRIDIHVIDLTTLTPVGNMLRAHQAYTPNSECFFIFLNVCDKYVASGAENCAAYIWDRHYGVCLNYLPHEDCVNAIAFNPMDTHMCVTASDDYSIRVCNKLFLVWRSRRSIKNLGLSGRDRPEGIAFRNNS